MLASTLAKERNYAGGIKAVDDRRALATALKIALMNTCFSSYRYFGKLYVLRTRATRHICPFGLFPAFFKNHWVVSGRSSVF